MTEGVGPVFAAGTEHFSKNGYDIVFMPDLNNDLLQREGKPPIYYWMPKRVRLAQKENKDYLFSFIHFVGVRGEGTHVGVEGNQEVAGGLIGFSTTAAPPPGVLEEITQDLCNKFRGKDEMYWGWRIPAAPMIRPVPIVSNVTTVTNLSPNPDGSVPQVSSGSPSSGGTGGTGGAGGPPGGPAGPRGIAGSKAPLIRSGLPPSQFSYPRSVPLSRGYRASNLDQWYYNLQGQGKGAIDPTADNAYSGLVGSLPAAMIWASFHGGTSALSVWQNVRMKVWSPSIHILLEGDWSKIQDHLSGAAQGGGWFWSADLKAEFNNMRVNGTIKVTTKVDATLPNADKIEEMVNKRSDMVFQKFMDQAQKIIFEPAPFKEEAAKASGGFLGLGGGVAFKLRRDKVSLALRYEEKREMAYLQEDVISGQLEGLYDQIKADPAAEKKYFTTLYLDDWERKVSRVIKPVVNWPDPAKQWTGQPVAFLSAQVGYPNTEGAIQWDGHVFQPNDGPNAHWETATSMKKATDVANPPAGWEPDKTFIKRQIHFTEPPPESENPFVKISIEKNVVDLDPGDIGSLVSDTNLEVRVDQVGVLSVGPMFLNVDLENPKQIVEVKFQLLGKTAEGKDRPPVTFTWNFDNQNEPRYWMVFTGQPDFLPQYNYQTRVLVKGSIFSRGVEWLGPLQDMNANGGLMVSVPTQEDIGVVVKRSFQPQLPPPSESVPVSTPPAATGKPETTSVPPPSTRSVPGRQPVDSPFSSSEGWRSGPPAYDGSSTTGPSKRTIGEPPPVASDTRSHSPSTPPSVAVGGWTLTPPGSRGINGHGSRNDPI